MEHSSKYANLPGVVYDQPDVYETEDVKEVIIPKSIDDSANVDVITTPYTDSYKKFEGHPVSVSGVNFANLPFGQKGYQTWGEWKLTAAKGEENEIETPLEKYHRLKSEVTDLKQFFDSLISKSQSKDSSKAVLTGDLTLAEAYKNIEALGESLNQIDVDNWAGSSLTSLPISSIEVLKNLKKNLNEPIKTGAVTGKSTTGKSSTSTGTGVTYELHCKPGLSKGEELALAQLESRLRSLELVVGESDKVTLLNSCTSERSISEAISFLSKKVSLMDVNQLDHLDTRLTSLLQKLSTVSEKKSQVEDLDKENRVNELLQLVASTEEQRSTLPVIVGRLSSLSSLEAEATAFSESISHLNLLQSQVASELSDAKANLSELKKSLAENIEAFGQAIAKIEAKLK